MTGREGRHLGYLIRQPLVSYLAIRSACPGPRLYGSPLHRVAYSTGTRARSMQLASPQLTGWKHLQQPWQLPSSNWGRFRGLASASSVHLYVFRLSLSSLELIAGARKLRPVSDLPRPSFQWLRGLWPFPGESPSPPDAAVGREARRSLLLCQPTSVCLLLLTIH